MKTTQVYGIGLESEGFIVERGTLKAIPRIDGISSYEWIESRLRSYYPDALKHVSPEQASVMLELKTDAYADDGTRALQEVLALKSLVNEILASADAEFVMVPVLPEPFEFVSATSDEGSRSAGLVREWGSTSEGRDLLHSTAIASLQINHSKPFVHAKSDEERLEIGRQLHNSVSNRFEELDALNAECRDWRGMTRMDNLRKLLVSVKSKNYRGTGFTEGEILVPPQFAHVDDMRQWMLAQSGVSDFREARSKNEHAVTMKLKRPDASGEHGYWSAESRVFDAVDAPSDMLRIIRVFDRVCSQVDTTLLK